MRRTEEISPAMKGMDTWAGDQVLSAMLNSEQQALDAVRAAIPAITTAADLIYQHLGQGEARHGSGRLVYAGAGCSGAVACQDNLELYQTFSWPEERSLVLLAGGDAARLRNAGPGEDDPEEARRAVRDARIQPADIVVAVAASGSTPWTCALLVAAQKAGARTIAVANNQDAALFKGADACICLDTGPEAIAGSTRLSAATAQKMAFNMLSTLAMTRMGHVMDGMMINFVADNDKLRTRAAVIVSQITGCPQGDALSALAKTGGRVKSAALVVSGLSPDQADQMLAEEHDNLRRVLQRLS